MTTSFIDIKSSPIRPATDNYDCNLVQSCRRLLYASGVQPAVPSRVEFG